MARTICRNDRRSLIPLQNARAPNAPAPDIPFARLRGRFPKNPAGAPARDGRHSAAPAAPVASVNRAAAPSPTDPAPTPKRSGDTPSSKRRASLRARRHGFVVRRKYALTA